MLQIAGAVNNFISWGNQDWSICKTYWYNLPLDPNNGSKSIPRVYVLQMFGSNAIFKLIWRYKLKVLNKLPEWQPS